MRSSRRWWIHSVTVALTVILISLLGLLDESDGWAYKAIVAQIGSELVQKQLAGEAVKDALDAISIVELTQPPSTFQQVSPAVTAVLVTASPGELR